MTAASTIAPPTPTAGTTTTTTPPAELTSPLASIERAVRMATGASADVLRARPIDEHRRLVEDRHGGRPMRVVSHFPFVGRGAEGTLTHDQVEAELDAVLSTSS